MTKQLKKDIRLIAKFVEVFCADKHNDQKRISIFLPGYSVERLLCKDCEAFMEYAIAKRMNCPLESEKPSCKHCKIHCYDKLRRDKVKEIMSYAGRRLIMKGRLDYLWHYLF